MVVHLGAPVKKYLVRTKLELEADWGPTDASGMGSDFDAARRRVDSEISGPRGVSILVLV